MSALRCVEGRLWRHDPQYDDPDLETDVGECPDCSGDGCGDDGDPVSKAGRRESTMTDHARRHFAALSQLSTTRAEPYLHDMQISEGKTASAWELYDEALRWEVEHGQGPNAVGFARRTAIRAIEAALSSSHQTGVREGLEKAAALVDGMGSSAPDMRDAAIQAVEQIDIAIAIRQLIREGRDE